jgi:hypothetical protein
MPKKGYLSNCNNWRGVTVNVARKCGIKDYLKMHFNEDTGTYSKENRLGSAWAGPASTKPSS